MTPTPTVDHGPAPGGLEVRPLSEAIGVEVLGIDVSAPVDEATGRALRDLFDTHHLLLFRGQELSGEDQIRLCSLLRPVLDPVAWVSNVERGAFHRQGDLLFHCDYAFTPHPMWGLSLYAVQIDDGAVPTDFASNARVLSALPEDLRARLDGVRVVHLIDTVNGRDNVRTRLCDVGWDAPEHLYPRYARPAVWHHPVLDIPLLFLMEQQASHVEGWSQDDSEALFAELFRYLYAPANRYSHHWAPGDLVVWDNLALQHGRRVNPTAARRSMRRVTMGERRTEELIRGTGFDPAVRAAMAADQGGAS